MTSLQAFDRTVPKWNQKGELRLIPVTFLLGSITVLCGCSHQPPQHAETAAPAAVEAVPVTASRVETKSVQRRVSVVGSLHGFEHITITPKVEGRVQRIPHDVGDRVAPNVTLVELDPVDYQLAVDESERSLEQELARLDLSEVPAGDFNIEELPSVIRTRLLVENAERQYERQNELRLKKVGVKENFDQAATELKVAEASLRQARIDARTSWAAVRQRQAMLSVARQKLSETSVKSPSLPRDTRAGQPTQFVISKRMASVGEVVRAFPSTPVVELVVDDVLKLHVMVPERYLSQVKLGLEVEVHVEAYPNEIFPGMVARIAPTIDPQSRSFDVEAHIPNSDHRLKHGGFAKVDVIVATDDQATTVPLEAVTRFAGVSKVFAIRDNVAQEVEIEIGMQGPGWVEAIGGLKSDDLVVTSGQSRLANGTPVTIREDVPKTAWRE